MIRGDGPLYCEAVLVNMARNKGRPEIVEADILDFCLDVVYIDDTKLPI